MKKLLASSMGSNEKVKSNKLFCTLKISKGLIEYVQKKIKFFFVPVLTDAGFPIWWYVAPTIINTFLESYDLTGKTIIPFATSGGSDIGKTNERLAPSCKGAKLMDGKVFKGSVGHQELAAWVEGLGL